METQLIDDVPFDADSDDDGAAEIDRGAALALLTWRGKDHPIYDGENYVGRAIRKAIDVPLDHSSMSEMHAVLDFNHGELFCKDLRSLNGTFVEKAPPGSGKFEPAKRNKLKVVDGCRIRFGVLECTIRMLKSSDENRNNAGKDDNFGAKNKGV
jgi:hypothetical protein